MIFRIFLLLSFLCTITYLRATDIIVSPQQIDNQLIRESQVMVNIFKNDSLTNRPPVKFKRGKAIIFTVLTGFLGGHRVYFGTHQRTPIIYSVTLGGLGVLALVDLIHIILTKDLSKFENKSQIIMWGK